MDSRTAYLAFLVIHQQDNTEEILDMVDKLEIGLSKIGAGNIYGVDEIASSILSVQEKLSKHRLMFREKVTEDAWARDIGDAPYMRLILKSIIC